MFSSIHQRTALEARSWTTLGQHPPRCRSRWDDRDVPVLCNPFRYLDAIKVHAFLAAHLNLGELSLQLELISPIYSTYLAMTQFAIIPKVAAAQSVF